MRNTQVYILQNISKLLICKILTPELKKQWFY